MAKYVVHYKMRKGTAGTFSTKTVECETEASAIRIVESQAKAQKPDYTFVLEKVEKK